MAGPLKGDAARLVRISGPALLILLATATTLLLGAALKAQCTYHGWQESYQYRHYCYSDIAPLYEIRNLNSEDLWTDAVPYRDQDTEYPVLTSYFYFLMANVVAFNDEPAERKVDYLNATFFILTLLGAVATYALWLIGVPWTRLLAWSAGPALIIHGLTNWDLLAVAFALLGWLRWREGRPFESALWFGLGGSAKLFPAFFLPFLLVQALLLRDRRAAARVVGGGFLGLGVPNLVGYVLSRLDPDPQKAAGRWVDMWRFHMDRFPDFETPWEQVGKPAWNWLVAGPLGDAWPSIAAPEAWRGFVGAVGAVALLAALGVLAWKQRTRGLDPLAAGALFTLVFLLINRVYSPQYTLWALPLVVLFRTRWFPLAGFLATDLVVFLLRYQIYTPPEGAPDGAWSAQWLRLHGMAVVLRWTFLAALTWGLWASQREGAATGNTLSGPLGASIEPPGRRAPDAAA